MNKLKNRIKLKRLALRIDAAVEENFGSSPSYPWFDAMLKDYIELFDLMRLNDPLYVALFESFDDKNKIKLLPTYV